MSIWCRAPIRSQAFSITVSVLRPRKSNFTSPAGSTHFMLNWVAGSIVAVGIAVERHQLVQRPVADHHAGGVGRGVAVEAFELQREVDQPLDLLVRVVLLLQQLLGLERLASVTGLAGLFGTSLQMRSTWP